MFRTALISLFITSAALADTWTVDDDGKADFDNIQAAIDAASNGDEIIVAPGTYTSTATSNSEVIDMRGKEIWLHSSAGAEVTIIDGEDTRRGIYCVNGETSNTIIEGFTITNGFDANDGGGMYNSSSSPTLIGCTFENNTALGGFYPEGGGMFNEWSSPTIENCTFTNNYSDVGGGMYNHDSSPTLTNCTFTDNTAKFEGGGMANDNSHPTLTNCTFTGNTATVVVGGGLCNWNNSNPTLTDTTVCGNAPDQIFGDWTDNDGNWVEDECPIADDDGDGIPDNIDNCYLYNPDQLDCNGNEVGDVCDIADGTSTDWNDNDIPDDCECLADINSDEIVDVLDLLFVISDWNTCTDRCASDVNDDGTIDVLDLLIVIAAWGPCE